MKNDDIAVKVENVYKSFPLPHEQARSVKSLFANPLKYIRSKSVTYETQHALKDISFEVKKGEFFGIVGRNGSGKSTLLKILAGIYQPTSGKVMTQGRIVPFIELGVGFNAELSGRDNIFLNGALLGFKKKEIEQKYAEIVDFAELEMHIDKKLKNYSSGMQVRLAFSIATVLAKSDILLVDEVLAVGDADFQRKCFRYFKSLKRKNKTVIFVTHDMNAVREYCDRAILIENQRVMYAGSSEEVSKRYEKLLQPKDENQKAEVKNSKQWGDRKLEIKNVEIHIGDISSRLACEIRVNKECSDPVIGFAILSSSGRGIFGTNSKIEKTKLPKMKTGELIRFSWEYPDLLADGDYTVTVAAQYDGGSTMAHWWEEATRFSIVRSAHVPYDIYPKIKSQLTVKNA